MAVVVQPARTRRRTVVTETSPRTVVTQRVSPSHGYPEKVVIFRAYQIIWYILGLFETLLIFRFIFRLSGASTASPFVRLVYGMTEPLIAPFRGIYPSVNVVGSVFEGITLLAMVVYLILAWGLVYLFQLVKPVDKAEVEQEVDSV